MRIGVIGHFPQSSYASGLADAYHTKLGQTVHVFPIHIYDEKYKYRWKCTTPRMPYPLSRIINGQDLDFIVNVQGCLDIENDIDIPVVYYHREIERGMSITECDYLMLKYNYMWDLYDHPNKYKCPPCVNPRNFNPNKEKDLGISYITRETSMANYIDLMERSEYALIKDTDHKYTKTLGISVRTMEALACKTIPLIQSTNGLHIGYRNIGIDESMCEFWTDHYPFTKELKYNKNKAQVGYDFVMANHTITNRAKLILDVIKNGTQ